MHKRLRRLAPHNRRLLLVYLYWLHAKEHLTRARLPLLAALLSLLALAHLPAHPLALPIAVGLASSITVIISAFIPRRSAHWIGA